MMIETTAELQQVCDRFARAPFVCVDTEFQREKTYFPILCLVQIATPEAAYCIDPLAPEIDLTPLIDLMNNPNVVKVFHAARQDVEIFYRLSGRVPAPLFDTQIGAMVCGFRNTASYQEVVRHYTGVRLDKSMRFTDWTKRPLTGAQEKYALCDVTYLCDVYQKMKARLSENGRLPWIDAETAELSDPNLYAPSDAFLCERLKYPIGKPEAARIYQALYLWREHKAREKDRPRRHILRDEVLMELSVLQPQTPSEMNALRGIGQGFEKSAFAAEILGVVQKALTQPPAFPIIYEKNGVLNAPQKTAVELLKLLLVVLCEAEGVAPPLVAEVKELSDFVLGKQTRFMTGWRHEIFGQNAALFLAGHLIIGYDPARKKACLVRKD